MRTRRNFLPISLLLIFGLGPISAALAQQEQPRADSRKARGYAFVSPNTQENLTLQEAEAGLKSEEERRLIEEARRISCRLSQPLGVSRAVGSWRDGAEHSTIIHVSTSESTLRYAASWLGKFARQKSILYFLKDSTGGARLYVLVLPRNRRGLAAISSKLDSDGIENRTLVPQQQGMLVYIVDLGNELGTKVLIAARGLRARISSLRGKAGFIGDDDRDKAQTVFAEEIRKYEAGHRHARRRCRKRIKSPDPQVGNGRLRKLFDTRSCLGLFSLQSST